MVMPGYKQTEIGIIPKDWTVANFGSKVKIFRGGSPRPIQDYLTQADDGVNWIKIGDVREGDKYITSTEEKIIPEGVSRSRTVHAGDFILSNSMSFGRPYILNIDGCIHDGWLTIQEYEQTFSKDFLYYLLSSDSVYQQYISMAAGSSVKNLNKEKVSALMVAYPEIGEQEKIAEALSCIDTLIAYSEKELAKKKAIKQGAMQELLTGKKRLPGFSGRWVPGKWKEVLDCFSSGATPYRGNPAFYKGKIKWVSSGELNYNRIVDTLEHISPEAKEKANLTLHPAGTFLMAITGLEAAGTRGSCAILGTPATTNQSCMAIYSTDKMSTEYLFHYYVQHGDELAFQYCQGTKQQSYTAAIVKELPIYYPEDVTEQNAIASVLSSMDDEIRALEQKLAKYRQVKQGMMQQLLTGKIRLV